MSWIFVADDGEQVHYSVPPQIAVLEAKLTEAEDNLRVANELLDHYRPMEKQIED